VNPSGSGTGQLPMPGGHICPLSLATSKFLKTILHVRYFYKFDIESFPKRSNNLDTLNHMYKKLFLFIFFIVYILACSSTNKENQETIGEMKFTVKISESIMNKFIRKINSNWTQFKVEFSNNSNETFVIQKPISGWNLFLYIKDRDRKNVYSRNYQFITPEFDDSFYVILQPLEKKVFIFKISDFGKFKTSYKNISQIVLNYKPQEMLSKTISVNSVPYFVEIELIQ
jgi:hypothetical protein